MLEACDVKHRPAAFLLEGLIPCLQFINIYTPTISNPTSPSTTLNATHRTAAPAVLLHHQPRQMIPRAAKPTAQLHSWNSRTTADMPITTTTPSIRRNCNHALQTHHAPPTHLRLQ